MKGVKDVVEGTHASDLGIELDGSPLTRRPRPSRRAGWKSLGDALSLPPTGWARCAAGSNAA